MSRSLRQWPIILAAVATIASPTAAQTAESPAPSPFLGQWELDLTRMPATYGAPPKRVLYRFRDIGNGQWRTDVDITAPDDSVRHMSVAYRPDGRMARGDGDTSEADSAAILLPAPNVLVMNLARNKMPGSVRVYTIAPDGRTMTEAAANIDDKGEPFVRTFHYRRLP
ncbi:hypothetical protein [Sphingomonas sp. Leaf21]|uniref:hypothetical protein n=1 Tax=Sphingomonas sp. Leaf21 TaxID=2876550 RepID=UPI001E38FDFA|nr:hypothetical protein [Sphingomonas sp. Leaf21]